MYYFNQKQTILKNLDVVFPFFEKPENLQCITPKSLSFKILSKQPLVMKRGAEFDYYISVFGLPMKWKTLITEYSPPNQFQDVQLKGPYKVWEHTHKFYQKDDYVIMEDIVKYDLYGGIFKHLINKLFILPMLNKIFNYRKSFIDNYFHKT